jgi:hypothetical protein
LATRVVERVIRADAEVRVRRFDARVDHGPRHGIAAGLEGAQRGVRLDGGDGSADVGLDQEIGPELVDDSIAIVIGRQVRGDGLSLASRAAPSFFGSAFRRLPLVCRDQLLPLGNVHRAAEVGLRDLHQLPRISAALSRRADNAFEQIDERSCRPCQAVHVLYVQLNHVGPATFLVLQTPPFPVLGILELRRCGDSGQPVSAELAIRLADRGRVIALRLIVVVHLSSLSVAGTVNNSLAFAVANAFPRREAILLCRNGVRCAVIERNKRSRRRQRTGVPQESPVLARC